MSVSFKSRRSLERPSPVQVIAFLVHACSDLRSRRHPMMPVIHSPFGSDTTSPPQHTPQSIEMYQPPARIGGGWGNREDDGADERARARTQRTVSRARAANAKQKARVLEGPSSQVPVVVHVPLPDLNQPFVTASPQEVVGASRGDDGHGERI